MAASQDPLGLGDPILGENSPLGDEESVNHSVSPVTQRDVDLLDGDTEMEVDMDRDSLPAMCAQDVAERYLAGLNVEDISPAGSPADASQQAPVYLGAGIEDEEPPRPASPLLEEFMSAYDGREIFLHEDVLRVTSEGTARRIDPRIRQAIEWFVTGDELVQIPEEWFVTWEALELGLRVCSALRKAVFDLHVAETQRRIPALPVLSIQENCGVAGMVLDSLTLFRVKSRRTREPTTQEEYLKAAADCVRVVVHEIQVADIQSYMDENSVDRSQAIAHLLAEAVRITKTEQTSQEERARVKALKAKTPGRGRGRKGERSNSAARSSSADSTQSGEFVQETGRQARRNEQARLLNLADVEQVDKSTGKTPKRVNNPPLKDDPMDTFDEVPAMENTVPLRAQEPMDIASRMKAHADAFVALQAELAVVGQSLPGVVAATAAAVAQPLVAEQSVPVQKEVPVEPVAGQLMSGGIASGKAGSVLKRIWANANDRFSQFVPTSWEQCPIGKVNFGCPPETNCYGLSDDEDWIRPTERDQPPSAFYQLWLDQLKTWPESYYTRDQREKLQFAIGSWYDQRERNWCPFSVCASTIGVERTAYITKPRFLRHICENHMHHGLVYQCDVSVGKESLVCEGYLGPRRGGLMRHMKDCHNMGIGVARARVNALHEGVLEGYRKLSPAAVKLIKSANAYFCEVPDGKFKAKFAKVDGKNKFAMNELEYTILCENRGNRRGFRKPTTTAPRGGGGGRSRAVSRDRRDRSRSSSPGSRKRRNQGNTLEEADDAYYTNYQEPEGRRYHQEYPDPTESLEDYRRRKGLDEGRPRYQRAECDSYRRRQSSGTDSTGSPHDLYHGDHSRSLRSPVDRTRGGIPYSYSMGLASTPGRSETRSPSTPTRGMETLTMQSLSGRAAPTLKTVSAAASKPPLEVRQEAPAAVIIQPVPTPAIKQEVGAPIAKAETTGGIKLKYTPVVNYFSREEKVSSEIGQSIVSEFQAAQQQLAVELHSRILGLFTQGLKRVHREEKDRLDKANQEVLSHKTRHVDEATARAEASTAFMRGERDILARRLEDVNTRFHRCFGVTIDAWDGSPEQAMALLRKKEDPGEG